jgi:N-acetylglucosaminyldiphosphoundecaprenol N-acetyl-beta-D-mannosaminyltransferase
MPFKTTSFFSYEIFSDSIDRIMLKDKLVINTINPHSFMVAENDQVYRKALMESDILLPDGIGITKAIWLLKNERVLKIAGMDIHNYLVKTAQKKSLKCFYLGSSPETLDQIKIRLQQEYPGIKINTFSPPFKKEFSKADNEIILKNINDYQPDILFLGMTAPKQEKWVYNNLPQINAKIICSIGAVFDFIGGNKKRPHQFWINLGLEGFVRVYREPRRLGKRLLFSDMPFLFKILSLKIKEFGKFR